MILVRLLGLGLSLHPERWGRANMKKLWRIGLPLAALLAILNGCDVPKAYQVANIVNPQDEDVDVRFRTTYYLRVFDLCRVDEDGKYGKYDRGTAKFIHRTGGHYRVIKDSLYRFRMTGQAQTFFNNVRFESGTLLDYQVDPFGTTIEFDEKVKRFKRSKCVTSDENHETGDCTYSPGKKTGTVDAQSDSCPQGEAKDTKFYLLGPEGIKELKLSERLVMAMSTDAKPLISALQRIGGIKAQSEAEAAGQYRVKRNRARVAVALEKLSDAQNWVREKGVDAHTSPEALEATILNLFKDDEVTR